MEIKSNQSKQNTWHFLMTRLTSAGKSNAPLLINIYLSYNWVVSGPTLKPSLL